MAEELDGCDLDFTEDVTTAEEMADLLLPPGETEEEDADA